MGLPLSLNTPHQASAPAQLTSCLSSNLVCAAPRLSTPWLSPMLCPPALKPVPHHGANTHSQVPAGRSLTRFTFGLLSCKWGWWCLPHRTQGGLSAMGHVGPLAQHLGPRSYSLCVSTCILVAPSPPPLSLGARLCLCPRSTSAGWDQPLHLLSAPSMWVSGWLQAESPQGRVPLRPAAGAKVTQCMGLLVCDCGFCRWLSREERGDGALPQRHQAPCTLQSWACSQVLRMELFPRLLGNRW